MVRGHEMDEERTNSFLSAQIGNEAKVGTWAEVLLGLVKDLLFAFPR
jgi:hypothetical protein